MTTTSSGPFEPYVPQLLLGWPPHVRYQQIDGSLVHVDISGFTAMSERLARKGKVGAEEVSAVLNNTFTELLTIAGDLGGDLLKFGGDALLLLFTEDGHPLRAVRASAAMRSRLRSIGKVHTPAGRVDLKMTVGVHSALHDAFLVGSTHRELILIGPGPTRTVEVEEGASAGEILLSPETAAQLPGSLCGEAKGPGVLLKRTPPPIDYAPSHFLCEAECRIFVPTALRPMVETRSEGEHRRITVGFVKFFGTDDILARLSPERVADRLDELVTLAQESVDEYGISFLSTDIDANGGKIILTGGVPTSTGTDEERVLRALRRIADECHGIPLKIGVNQGPAFAGDIGAPFRRTYTVIGDAVNLAARVMGKADPGEVLATGSVLERSATTFALTELPPFEVKGKTDPVRAWKVGVMEGRRQETAVTADTPLFGREREVEILEPYVQGRQPAGVIDICGPSGIGKSRFVRELRSRSRNLLWHFSDCDEYESSTPYYVFRRLLREVAGIGLDVGRAKAGRMLTVVLEERAPDLLPWLPLLATAMDLPAAQTEETARLDPDFRQPKLQQTVAAFFDAIIEGPGSLVIEDAQWLDTESRDLIAFLARFAQDRPWHVFLVHRPLEIPLSLEASQQLDLDPLDAEGSLQLVEHVLGDTPLMQHQLDDLVERGGGNPLFLLELVEAARTGQELPDNVESLVQARIDRLDPAQRTLLRYSSVAGMTFDPKLIASAIAADLPEASNEDVWDGLDEFLVRRSSGDLRFRQTLFHDVAYSGLSFRARRRLHERIGRVLEDRADNPEDLAEILSLHFALAGDYEEAWQYSRSAGLQACAKHANVAATTFYRRALESARNIEVEPIEIARVAESLGDVAEPAGLHDDAEKGLRRAAELRATDPGGRARIFRKLGLLRERAGKYPQALRWFSRGLKYVEEPKTDREKLQRIELQLAYAGVRFRQSRYVEAISWADAAIPAAEELNERQAAAHGYYLVALARMRSGQTQRQGHTERALSIYEELGDLVGQSNVLNKLGIDAYHAGDWTSAREYYRRSREAREKAGDSVRAAIITQNEALVLSDQGRLDEAEQLFKHARREFQAAQDQMATGVATSNLGRILTRRRQFTEGLELLETALKDLREIGATQFVLDAETRIAENLILSGDVGAGERMIDDIAANLSSPKDDRHCLLHRIRAYAFLQRGENAKARASLRHGIGDARSGRNRYELALQLDALAKLTDDSALRQEADSLLDALGIETVPVLPGVVLTA